MVEEMFAQVQKIFFLLCTIFYVSFAQQLPRTEDTLNIKYEIVSHQYYPDKNILKIKVPPFLTTTQLMEQIKLAVQWPGDPPPEQVTFVYVFKDSARVGTQSTTGAIYLPGQGYRWSLTKWVPIDIQLSEPSAREKIIYNTLLDSMFARGLEFNNQPVKEVVARQFHVSSGKLDSIYFKVKYWLKYGE